MKQRGFAVVYLLIGVLILAALVGVYYFTKIKPDQINSFIKECKKAGGGILEIYPPSCQTPDGKIFGFGKKILVETNLSPALKAQEVDETVYTEGTRSTNWKTYTGNNFSITYPNQLITTPSELVEVIESIQFDKRGQEKKNYIRVSVYSGGEVRFNNRKETYLFYGLHNAQQENFLIDGVNAWRYSGTDAEGENITQHVLFYKDNLEFEIDNFNIDRDIFDQIISTFKFN